MDQVEKIINDVKAGDVAAFRAAIESSPLIAKTESRNYDVTRGTELVIEAILSGPQPLDAKKEMLRIVLQHHPELHDKGFPAWKGRHYGVSGIRTHALCGPVMDLEMLKILDDGEDNFIDDLAEAKNHEGLTLALVEDAIASGNLTSYKAASALGTLAESDQFEPYQRLCSHTQLKAEESKHLLQILMQHHCAPKFLRFLLETQPSISETVRTFGTHLAWNAPPEKTQMLLKHGMDPNAPDGNEYISLHHDVRNPETVELLLKNGANPNAKDCYGRTPLFNAMRREVLSKHVSLLLQYGADVNAKDEDGKSVLDTIFETVPHKKILSLVSHGAHLTETVRKLAIRAPEQSAEDRALADFLCEHYGLSGVSTPHRFHTRFSTDKTLSNEIDKHNRFEPQPLRAPKLIEAPVQLFKRISFTDNVPPFYYMIRDGQFEEVLEFAKKNHIAFKAEHLLMRPESRLWSSSASRQPSVIDMLTEQGRLRELFSRDVWNLSNISDLPSVVAQINPQYLERQLGVNHVFDLLNDICKNEADRLEALQRQILHTRPAQQVAAPVQPDMPHAEYSDEELEMKARVYEDECTRINPAKPTLDELAENAFDANATIPPADERNPSRIARERLQWRIGELEEKIASLQRQLDDKPAQRWADHIKAQGNSSVKKGS